jgi:hypothetical protein
MTDRLLGRLFDPRRPEVTISDVREVGGEIMLAVCWDTVPGQAPATSWLRCSERDPELVLDLIRLFFYEDVWDDPRISDVEPPPDVPCGGWLAPDGRLWRCSEIVHRLIARRIARQLCLPASQDDPGPYLEAHGWRLVLPNGHAGSRDGLSQAQRDTLFDLAVQYPTMRPGLMAALGEEEA